MGGWGISISKPSGFKNLEGLKSILRFFRVYPINVLCFCILFNMIETMVVRTR